MAALDDPSRKTLPPAAGGSINGHRVLLGVLLLFIGIATITGIVMTISSGQPTLAIAIGIVAAAFFCRVGC